MTQLHWLWQNSKACFQALGGWIARTASFGKLAIVTPLVGSVWLIGQELRNDLVTIEPIGVPQTLSSNGYTPGVAGYRLRDALNAYAGASAPGDERHSLNSNLDSVAHDDDSLHLNLELSISAGKELPDIVVPQIGLSARAIASYLRNGLGTTGYAITGEITAQEKKYALRLRIDGREVFSSSYETENPDDLMKNAAPIVMQIIRPAAYAMAQYRDGKEDALLKANQIIAHYDQSDINVQWAYLLKGKHALRNNDFKEAQEMFSKAVSSNPNSEQPHLQLGVALLRGSRTAEAIAQFENVLAFKPKSARAYNNIGVALATEANLAAKADKKKDMDPAKLQQAVAKYQQAIAIAPGYAISYNNLGLTQSHLGPVKDAIESYRSAVNIAPQYMLARWNLASALQKENKFDAAVNEYRAALVHATNAKDRAMLHTYVGDVLRDQAGNNGNLEPAIAEYQQAIAINCYGWAHYNLGRIWRGQGKIREGIDEFYQAAICDPKEADFRTNFENELRKQQAGPMTLGLAKN
jgi:tetratricopeptide (TPR) repeat protein